MMDIVSGEEDNSTGTVHTPPVDHDKKHTLPVEVTKLDLVADDENEALSQENQDNITVVKSGNNAYRINVAEGKTLNSFVSTNPAQGKAEWIGLVVNTGQETILGLNFNGAALSQTDVEEAESVGVGAGSFVFWVKYENLPMSFVLTDDKDVYDDTTTIIKK